MNDQADDGFDPTSESARTIGQGFFEEEIGPGSAMAHLYRGEIHRMKLCASASIGRPTGPSSSWVRFSLGPSPVRGTHTT